MPNDLTKLRIKADRARRDMAPVERDYRRALAKTNYTWSLFILACKTGGYCPRCEKAKKVCTCVTFAV